MSQRSRAASLTAVGWPDLVGELDRWRDAERVATLWWRDDDAVAPSEKLDRLMLLAEKVPISLAVIPGLAKPELAVWLAGYGSSTSGTCVAVLQHGWRHLNHSAGGKKSEFPPERRHEDVAFELAAGRRLFSELFGARALPFLVPPWNRLDDCFLPTVRNSGIDGISRANPRRAFRPVPGLIEVNVHVDLVAWTSDRGFIGETEALGGLVHHFRARRLGAVCGSEPTGILTHHLIQDEATNVFLHRLFAVTSAHAAVRWLDATEVFSPAH